jgi:hypothetical protein
VADRTVQNAGFSFIVLQSPDSAAAERAQPNDTTASHAARDEGSPSPVAPNAVRVWRGYAVDRPHLDAFHQALVTTFIPITTQVMGKLGLTAYLPAIVPSDPTPTVPDEIALVFYRSQADYEVGAYGTTAGRAYQNLHLSLFNFASTRPELPASTSGFPILLKGSCESGQPYYLFSDEVDWYQGTSDVFVGVCNSDKQELAESVLQAAKSLQANRVAGLDGFILLVVDDVLIYWRHWELPGAREPWNIDLELRKVLHTNARVVEVDPSEYAIFRGVSAGVGQYLNIHFNRK